MFWSMDKSCHMNELQGITDYLVSFFEFAAESASNHFDKKAFQEFLPSEADWLIERLTSDRWDTPKSKDRRPMSKNLEGLFQLTQVRRMAISEALRHDICVAEHMDKPFCFKSPLLEPDERDLIRRFFIHFYEVGLCEIGFKLPGYTDSYRRKEFARAYFSGKNKILKYVCPICLCTMTDAEVESDVEHFFPKYLYPILALHPVNLYFSCKACNQTYKGTKNPLENPGCNARMSFLPYVDTVRDRVKLKFSHEDEDDEVDFVPINPAEAYINEKVESLNRLYKLNRRWTGLLEYHNNMLVDELLRDGIEGKDNLKKEISDRLRKMRQRCDKSPGDYLNYQYTQWLYDFRLDALNAELAHKGTVPGVS